MVPSALSASSRKPRFLHFRYVMLQVCWGGKVGGRYSHFSPFTMTHSTASSTSRAARLGRPTLGTTSSVNRCEIRDQSSSESGIFEHFQMCDELRCRFDRRRAATDPSPNLLTRLGAVARDSPFSGTTCGCEDRRGAPVNCRSPERGMVIEIAHTDFCPVRVRARRPRVNDLIEARWALNSRKRGHPDREAQCG